MMMMGMEENRGKMVSLIVRHLPEAIPHETLSRLFSHYGALQVRPCAAAKLRNSAFLDFADEVTASQAQVQLNRLRFLGKVLSVERAGFQASKDVPTSERMPATLGEVPSAGALPISGSALNPVNVGEPIAPRLGVDYPFPSHLEYAYPPPDGNILTNIVNALIAVPRFYTQVLHLMNKMNLPAPFRAALPTPPLPLSEPVPPPPPPPLSTAAKPNFAELSSDESELESSDESDVVAEKPRRKKAKRSAIVGPAVDKDVPHEAVGVKPVLLVPRNIPTIKKRNPVLQIKIALKPASCDISEEGTTCTKRMNQEKEESNGKTYATLEDIQAGKMPPEEILSLPKFKNYTAGIPSAVLYIKNLSKDVVHDDFYYIFGSFFGSIEAAKSRINIKLMQEGRMRGQAFVTFQSVDLAERALNVVNGFVFKEKPMIIQFGRSAPQGETNS